MANIFDYLAWRKDVPFSVSPFNEVDSLVLASPISLLIQTDMSGVTVLTVVVSAVTLAAGFVGAYVLAKGSKG